MAVERKPAPFSASDIANGLLSIRTKDEIRPPVFGTLDCVGDNLERLLLLVQILPLQKPELHLFVEAGHLKNMLYICLFVCFLVLVFFGTESERRFQKLHVGVVMHPRDASWPASGSSPRINFKAGQCASTKKALVFN